MTEVPTAAHLAEVYAAAVLAYPAEACGFIRDAGVRECVNMVEDSHASDRTAATGYAFGPRDLLDLARSFDGDEPVRVIYHSHPDVGAYFSAEDQRFAVVDGNPTFPVDHLVVDVTATGVRGACRFAFSAAEGRYVLARTYGDPRGVEGER